MTHWCVSACALSDDVDSNQQQLLSTLPLNERRLDSEEETIAFHRYCECLKILSLHLVTTDVTGFISRVLLVRRTFVRTGTKS